MSALGLVAIQPPGSRTESVDDLVAEMAPEFLAWRASVDPDGYLRDAALLLATLRDLT